MGPCTQEGSVDNHEVEGGLQTWRRLFETFRMPVLEGTVPVVPSFITLQLIFEAGFVQVVAHRSPDRLLKQARYLKIQHSN